MGSWNGPLGTLCWTRDEHGLTALAFSDGDQSDSSDDGVARALARWFEGELDALDALPLAPEGTDFQRKVWTALRTIPPGHTTTYGELARSLDLPASSARAVGSAVGANPLALLVPCHRVLGSKGELTGFAWGVARKRWLLDHERHHAGTGQQGLFIGR